jgi:hypothetical protein
MSGLDSRSVRVGVLADRLALGQACLRVLPSLSVRMFATHISLINYRRCLTLAIDSVFKWNTFPSESDQTLRYTYLETRLSTLANNQLDALFQLISLLWMFRATQCSSSGELIVSIHHLVYIALCRWLRGMPVLSDVGKVRQVGY